MTFKLKSPLWMLILAACLTPCLAISATPNLRTDNEALIKHIKATDFVFQSLLGKCVAESLKRSKSNGLRRFAYNATCAIRSRAEEDCQSYRVTARGTIDTTELATVRDIHLHLLCPA